MAAFISVNNDGPDGLLLGIQVTMMRQTMNEAEIIHHFRAAGASLEAETLILDAVIRNIVIQGQKVTSKAIILCLIAEIECVSDQAHLAILRNVLEIVIGRTPDDL